MRKSITTSKAIVLLLILQFIPLVMFPASSFKIESQEWWLPVLLAVLTLIAAVQIIARRSPSNWPWLLFSFSQGFNIISRIMMLLPHATTNNGGTLSLNLTYLGLSIVSMLMSTFLLWYTDLPEVRLGLTRG